MVLNVERLLVLGLITTTVNCWFQDEDSGAATRVEMRVSPTTRADLNGAREGENLILADGGVKASLVGRSKVLRGTTRARAVISGMSGVVGTIAAISLQLGQRELRRRMGR